MTNRTAPSVRSYLDELDRALSDLPPGRRQEIIGDIRTHIDAALAAAPEQTPAVIANILDHLGTPAEIAEAARAELPPARPRIAARDVIAIVLLLVGGIIVPFAGWVAGVVMLWISAAWRTKDKLIATLLVPGGLLTPLLLLAVPIRNTGGIPFYNTTPICEVPLMSSTSNGSNIVENCTSNTWLVTSSTILTIVVMIIAVAGPIFSTIWLTRHAQRIT